MAAAQLWLAAGALRGNRAGAEFKRAFAAVGHVRPETAETRELEARILLLLIWVSEGGYAWGSEESIALSRRAETLAQQAQATPDDGDDDAVLSTSAGTFYALCSAAALDLLMAINAGGMSSYVSLTANSLSTASQHAVAFSRTLAKAIPFAPDLTLGDYAHNASVFTCTWLSAVHANEDFDRNLYTGTDGSKMRANVERYDFARFHEGHKTSACAMDVYLYGGNELGLLLWFGDVQTVRAGLRKQLDAWAEIRRLLDSGERAWLEYVIEGGPPNHHQSLATMWMLGDRELLRETVCDL